MCFEIHLCGAINVKQLLIQLIEEWGDEYEMINYQCQTNFIWNEPHFN